MNLYILIENKRISDELYNEHGLSIYIETNKQKLLFDTGASGLFMDNAKSMNVDLDTIDTVVISHSHNDHSGGLKTFLAKNKTATVYMSINAQKPSYSKALGFKTSIGIPQEIFDNYAERIVFINSTTKLNDNIFIVHGFTRRYPIAKSNQTLLVKSGDSFVPDTFDHEQALVINNNGKLVVITGCSHNGIDNMLEAIQAQFPDIPIQAAIGGFHLPDFPKTLFPSSSTEINSLADRLISYNIEKIYTCHCTGNKSFKILKQRLDDKLHYFYGGMKLIV